MKTMLFMLTFCLLGGIGYAGQKATIGETAWIGVEGVPFSYLARIDTGANVTSIHALDVKITDENSVPQKNVGKAIIFQTMNRDGKTQRLTGVITRVSTVKNSQGTEQRYIIELPLSWKHVKKKVEVNLRDRSKMTYKLLIGRNWLSNDFLVDVDIQAHEKGEK